MPEGRPAIPAELRRTVLVEAGHRCAIPTCRSHPVDIEHINDWAQVKEHKFENLIALCPTCHRRKGNGPDQIDRKSLRQYKANLAVLHSRYSDLERRLLEICADRIQAGANARDLITLGPGAELSLWYLTRDGYLERIPFAGPAVYLHEAKATVPTLEIFRFTPAGVEFVQRWAAAQPLDPPVGAEQE